MVRHVDKQELRIRIHLSGIRHDARHEARLLKERGIDPRQDRHLVDEAPVVELLDFFLRFMKMK